MAPQQDSNRVTAMRYAMDTMKLCAAQVCLRQGASGATQNALGILADVMRQMIENLGRAARDLAVSTGRSEINYADVLEACFLYGIRTQDLRAALEEGLEGKAIVATQDEGTEEEGVETVDMKGKKKEDEEIEEANKAIFQYNASKDVKGRGKRSVHDIVQNAIYMQSASQRRPRGSFIGPIQCEAFPAKRQRKVLQEDDFDEALEFYLRKKEESAVKKLTVDTQKRAKQELEACTPLPSWMPRKRSLPPFPPKHTFDKELEKVNRVLEGVEAEKMTKEKSAEQRNAGRDALRHLKEKLGEQSENFGFDSSLVENLKRRERATTAKQPEVDLSSVPEAEQLLIRAAMGTESSSTVQDGTTASTSGLEPPEEEPIVIDSARRVNQGGTLLETRDLEREREETPQQEASTPPRMAGTGEGSEAEEEHL